jgi:hypothetical protein
VKPGDEFTLRFMSRNMRRKTARFGTRVRRGARRVPRFDYPTFSVTVRCVGVAAVLSVDATSPILQTETAK